MTLVEWTADMKKWVEGCVVIGETYPFENDFPLLYLGEIRNMKEHGVFVGKSGTIYSGYHIENFEELSEEEV